MAIARAAGLSVNELSDVEQYPDALLAEISMGEARRICSRLGLDLTKLAEQHYQLPPTSPVALGSAFRNQLVADTRTRMGMSQADLSDKIGFEESTVQWLERTSDFIEALPVNVVIDLANALLLDPRALVQV